MKREKIQSKVCHQKHIDGNKMSLLILLSLIYCLPVQLPLQTLLYIAQGFS